jgi:ribulose-5-phosphate 4-epimerase/fuculose-1-phosphate aldolase
MYVWGDTWEQAKRHGECLHYLFEVAINMRRLGMDFNSPPLPLEVAIEPTVNMSNTEVIQKKSSTMKLQYLDCPSEKATLSILSQLGVVSSDTNEKVNKASTKVLSADLCLEHKANCSVSYKVVHGDLNIDVRDEADCWIRISLRDGDFVSIPMSLYRRVSIPTGEETEFIETSSIAKRNSVLRYTNTADSVALNSYHTYRELVCELCRQFFTAGWVTGTGGSISIRHGNRIYMTPSGVQKERILPDELFVLDLEGEVLAVPEQKPGSRPPKLSDCAPLFLHAFKQRNAGKSCWLGLLLVSHVGCNS